MTAALTVLSVRVTVTATLTVLSVRVTSYPSFVSGLGLFGYLYKFDIW